MSSCSPYLKVVFSNQNILFVALFTCWRDEKMKVVLNGFLLLGDHYRMVHHGSGECLADNPITVLLSLKMITNLNKIIALYINLNVVIIPGLYSLIPVLI